MGTNHPVLSIIIVLILVYNRIVFVVIIMSREKTPEEKEMVKVSELLKMSIFTKELLMAYSELTSVITYDEYELLNKKIYAELGQDLEEILNVLRKIETITLTHHRLTHTEPKTH